MLTRFCALFGKETFGTDFTLVGTSPLQDEAIQMSKEFSSSLRTLPWVSIKVMFLHGVMLIFIPFI